jgi:hypothetical protein
MEENHQTADVSSSHISNFGEKIAAYAFFFFSFLSIDLRIIYESGQRKNFH